MYLYFRLRIYLSVCVSIYLCIYLPVYLSICVSTYLCIYLAAYLSICVSICLCIYRCTCACIYLSVCFIVSFYLSIYLSICLSVSLPSIYPFVYLYVCVSIHVCVCVYGPINRCRWQHPNEAARLPQFLNLTVSKTKQVCETCSIFELDNFKSEAILLDFLQKWKAACWASWRPRANAFCDSSTPSV